VTEGRVPPYDKQAEGACLGAVLLNNDALPIVGGAISDQSDFYVDAYRRIYNAMLELSRAGSVIDAVTLGNELIKRGDLDKIGGPMIIGELTDSVATVANVEHYAKIVKEQAAVRRMIYAAQEIVARGFGRVENVSEYLAAARKSVTLAATTGSMEGPVKIGEELAGLINDLETGKMPPGLVRTGIENVDTLTGGLWPGLLTIVGGRPGMGKSAFVLNMLTNAALDGRHTLYIPTEDARRYVTMRELARFADVDLNDLMMRTVHPDDWRPIMSAANKIHGLPLWVDDTPGLSSERIGQIAALHKQLHGLDLLVVDHLGELTDKGDNQTHSIENAAKGCRDIAKELDIPVVLACQLNREVEHRRDRRPSLHDLRQSGAIEQAARVVWFVYRRGYYKQGCEEDPDMQLIVAKATHGKTGTIRLWSDMTRMYIRSWEIDRDGPFPDEKSGKYVAPKHDGAPPPDVAPAPAQDDFFNDREKPAQDSPRHWTDDY